MPDSAVLVPCTPNPRRPTAPVKRFIAGCLEVRAVRDTRAGSSEYFVPAGSVGYVVSGLPGRPWLVCWPAFLSGNRVLTSAHDRADVEPTGRRG